MSIHSGNVAFETQDSANLPHQSPQKGGYDIALRVAAMEQVVPHEHYHGLRVDSLTARLRAEGKLINPPIVAQHGDKYVVLDGATRLTALRQMGYPSIIVQVVDLTHQVQLGSWNHVVRGASRGGLLDLLRGIGGLQVAAVTADEAASGNLPAGALGWLMCANQEAFMLKALPAAGVEAEAWWLHLLNEVVERYGQWGNVERTLSRDMEALVDQFPDLAGLVVFPRFTPQQILELAGHGHTVPAGITRFVIPGRILRLNAPLHILAADQPLAVKQAWLDDLIRTKVQERQLRFYEEPVVLLDE